MKIITSVASMYQAVVKLLGTSQQSQNKLLFYPKDENGFYLVAGNPSVVTSAVEIIADVTGFDSPCWVEANKLYSFTNAIHNTPNLVIASAGKRWKFAIGESNFTTNTIIDESFYLLDVPEGTTPIRIKSNEVDNLSRVSLLSAKDRGVYSGTYMIISGKYLSCIATDGFGAGVVWFETEKVLEGRKDYFIPSEALLELKKAINVDSDVWIHEDGNKIHFVSDDFRMICNEIAGKDKYPADRIASALRCELVDGVESPATDLIDRLSACSVIKDVDQGNAPRVNIKSTGESLDITSFDNNTKMHMKAPIIRSFGDEALNFDINPRFIQTAVNLLKQLGEVSSILIHNSTELNWVFITANGVNGRFAFAKMHPQE